MTDQTEPEDTCRPVDIDGETIRVRGSGEMSAESQSALAEVIRAAKRKMAAEPQPIRQQIRAVAFNAVAPALKRHDEWLRLTVRRTVADAVLAAIEDFLDLGDAEAWCKICHRVWNGKGHRCESDAEAAIARVRELAADVDDPNWRAPGTEVAARIRLALTDPAEDGPSVADCAADDRAHWTQKYAGE